MPPNRPTADRDLAAGGSAPRGRRLRPRRAGQRRRPAARAGAPWCWSAGGTGVPVRPSCPHARARPGLRGDRPSSTELRRPWSAAWLVHLAVPANRLAGGARAAAGCSGGPRSPGGATTPVLFDGSWDWLWLQLGHRDGARPRRGHPAGAAAAMSRPGARRRGCWWWLVGGGAWASASSGSSRSGSSCCRSQLDACRCRRRDSVGSGTTLAYGRARGTGRALPLPGAGSTGPAPAWCATATRAPSSGVRGRSWSSR